MQLSTAWLAGLGSAAGCPTEPQMHLAAVLLSQIAPISMKIVLNSCFPLSFNSTVIWSGHDKPQHGCVLFYLQKQIFGKNRSHWHAQGASGLENMALYFHASNMKKTAKFQQQLWKSHCKWVCLHQVWVCGWQRSSWGCCATEGTNALHLLHPNALKTADHGSWSYVDREGRHRLGILRRWISANK